MTKMDTKMFRDAYELANFYVGYRNDYQFKPDREEFPYPKVGTVLDREMSVRWNEEEVERLRAAYENEVKQRQKSFYENINAMEERMRILLAKEYRLSKEEANIIWEKACEDSHNMMNTYNHFLELADMYEQLKEVKEQSKKA